LAAREESMFMFVAPAAVVGCGEVNMRRLERVFRYRWEGARCCRREVFKMGEVRKTRMRGGQD
jgi:hypothetical protein